VCTIPRAKTERPQVLEIPAVLQPFIRAWWERQGCSRVGPVFPARRGKRKGGFKQARGASFAGRLRRGLLKAGITRHELHNDTPTTLRCDFHSFRRAFASALAGAEVSAQHAMKLTGHSDAKVHSRYVMDTPAMRVIPLRALPTVGALPVKPPKLSPAEQRKQKLLLTAHADATIVEAPAGDNSGCVTLNHSEIGAHFGEPANTQDDATSREIAVGDPLLSRWSQVRVLPGALGLP